MSNAVNSPAWRALADHAAVAGQRHLGMLFAADPRRFERFSLSADGLLLDFSKQRVDGETLALLHELWRTAELPRWIARMRAGEAINHTERRAVLHIALRHAGDQPIMCDGRDVMPEVRAVLERMEQLWQQAKALEKR